MGVLDELKRQAESRQRQNEAQGQDQTQRLRGIDAALGTIDRYFTELANSLNVVKPEVRRDFAVQGNARLHALLQADYFVRERKNAVDGRECYEYVALHYHATGKEALVLETYADHATDRLRNYLRAYGLRFDTRDFRNERGVTLKTAVSILPDVPASITAGADCASGTVTLKLRNVEAIGDAEYRYDPDEIDRPLLDELAKLVLGQANGLRALGRHQELLRMKIVAHAPPPASQPEQPGDPAPHAGTRQRFLDSLKSFWKR